MGEESPDFVGLVRLDIRYKYGSMFEAEALCRSNFLRSDMMNMLEQCDLISIEIVMDYTVTIVVHTEFGPVKVTRSVRTLAANAAKVAEVNAKRDKVTRKAANIAKYRELAQNESELVPVYEDDAMRERCCIAFYDAMVSNL